MAKENTPGMIEGTDPASTDVGASTFKGTPLRGKMLFGDSIEIDLGARLNRYSNQYVGAYVARSLGAEAREYIAYVCEPQFTPRNRLGPTYAAINNNALVRLVASGIGRIVDQGISRFVFIYDNPLGKPLAETDTGLVMAMRPERVMEKIVTPLVKVLKDLRDNDIVHGGIRVTNLFDGGKENYEYVILGDCLSLPPSMAQPAVYEPVDRALAQPSGRGLGTNQDDMYSLGITLAFLMRTKDPMKGKNDADILQNKMQYGTYATVLDADEHLSSAMLELLRGLLQDDRMQRWTLEDVLNWMDGKRLSPKQSGKKLKAARGITFNGKSYTYPALLARDLFTRPLEVVQMVDNGELYQWIKRSLDDEQMLMRYEAAVHSAEEQGRGPAFNDRLIARMAICLDPEGPIRYKHISVTGEGIATALAEAVFTGKDLPIYTEIFMGTLLSYWMTTLTNLNHDMANFVSRFDPCRNYIRQPGPGFGLERIMYFLNPDVHCLSPLVSRYYARSPEEFLVALEEMASTDPQRHPPRILDRHSIAFLSVKDRKVVEPYLFDLSSSEPYKCALGTLQCLASIQRYCKMGPVKNLSQWMAEFVSSVYERFHDRDVKKDLRKKISDVRDKGDLSKMLNILDNPELLRTDLLNFRRAMQLYRALVNERDHLNVQIKDSRIYGRREGRETSVVVAGLIATFLIVGVIIMFMNGAHVL